MNFEKQSFEDFCAVLASSSPTPGGGTASAAAGALGASLLSMVCALTLGKEKLKDSHELAAAIDREAKEAAAELRALMRLDAESFDAMVAARKLPKETDEEKGRRRKAMEDAARHAADVPMKTARIAAGLLERAPQLAERGNPNAASDVGVAALLLAAAAEGALLNVGINLGSISDASFVGEMEKETANLSQEIERDRAQTIALVRKTFKK
jgi:formiminotetrahydrofolate cyclodeaminase